MKAVRLIMPSTILATTLCSLVDANAQSLHSCSKDPLTIGARYDLISPYTQPDIVKRPKITLSHKVFAVDFDPNHVQVQRRIRQQWSTAPNADKRCILESGAPDDGCQWHDWDISWTYQYDADATGTIKVFTAQTRHKGNAFANWPLFWPQQHVYGNPSEKRTPKTLYRVETRFNHPKVGWLYATAPLYLYCDGNNAWQSQDGTSPCLSNVAKS